MAQKKSAKGRQKVATHQDSSSSHQNVQPPVPENAVLIDGRIAAPCDPLASHDKLTRPPPAHTGLFAHGILTWDAR